MAKVLLTREQDKALKCLKEVRTNEQIIRTHVRTKYVDGVRWNHKVRSLNELSTDHLVLALIIGYEVEQTREEKLLNEYRSHKCHYDPKHRHYADGIKAAIDILGITIPGINSEVKSDE